MAEFYADWGLGGMFASIFLYGCLIGACIEVLRRFVQPAILVNPFLITIVMAVYQFEHQFIKTFAALVSTTVAALVIQRLFRKTFMKSFGAVPLDAEEPTPEQPVPPSRPYRTLPRTPRGSSLPHG
jgi:uncharacterized membrane protein YraQ (UPF0718 family)